MRRAGLLHCTNCAAPRFASLRQRGQLPFFSEDEGAAAKWQTFSLRDAFELKLMIDLMDGSGVGHEEASYIIRNAHTNLEKHPLNQPEDAEIWFAGATVSDPHGGSEDGFWRMHFADRFDLLNAAIFAKKHDNFRDAELIRVTAVNASRAASLVRSRAQELGLPEGEDYATDWMRA